MWNVFLIMLLIGVVIAIIIYRFRLGKVCTSATLDKSLAITQSLKRRVDASVVFLNKSDSTSKLIIDNLYFVQNTLAATTSL